MGLIAVIALLFGLVYHFKTSDLKHAAAQLMSATNDCLSPKPSHRHNMAA
jgi:hypothetical protein